MKINMSTKGSREEGCVVNMCLNGPVSAVGKYDPSAKWCGSSAPQIKGFKLTKAVKNQAEALICVGIEAVGKRLWEKDALNTRSKSL